jgi:hypothetical protein
VEFAEALDRLGFVKAEERAGRGARVFRATPNRFLTYWVHAYGDGTALFTWEFAIVDYLATRDVALGSSEALNTFMFPARDDRGPQDGAWLVGAVDRAEGTLQSIRFDAPEG